LRVHWNPCRIWASAAGYAEHSDLPGSDLADRYHWNALVTRVWYDDSLKDLSASAAWVLRKQL